MSRKCSGVQKRIKEVTPEATYVHCYAHCLNLALVDSSKHVSDAADFFALMEILYVFISSSKAHAVYIHQQSLLHLYINCSAYLILVGLADALL